MFNKLTSTILKSSFFVFFIFVFVSPVLAINTPNIGSLFFNIWKYNSSAIDNLSNLTSSPKFISLDQIKQADIDEITKVNTQSKLAIQAISDKPIYRFIGDDPQVLNLSDKLKQTVDATSNLYSSLQNLKSRSANLAKRWPDLTDEDIKSELTLLSSIFTQDVGLKDSNIIATTDWLKNSWDSPLLVNISDEAQAAQSQVGILLNDTISLGKVNSPAVLLPILTHVTKLDELVGTSLAKSTDQNLYGYVRKITDQISFYDLQTKEGIRILSELNQDPDKNQIDAINQFSSVILGMNHVTTPDSFFSPSIGLSGNKNKILDLLAIIEANKILLGGKTGQVIKNIWMDENDHMIFRIVVSNPSRTENQKVPLKISLPPELKIEQIINHDDTLTVGFDPNQTSLIAAGEFLLLPLETRTLKIESENIWSINTAELDTLKSQVNNLANYLDTTDFQVKANSIRNEIFTSLDKIVKSQKEAVTPETVIQNFRDSSFELNSIEDKITSLMSLVIQTKTTGKVLGISGTFRSIPIRGVAILIIISLVFWTFYLNAYKSEPKENKLAFRSNEDNPMPSKSKQFHYREISNPKLNRISQTVIITLISGGLGAIGVSILLKVNQNLLISHKDNTNTSTKVLGATPETTTRKFPYEIQTLPPKSGSIPVHSLPSFSSPQVTSLKNIQTISVFQKVGHWALISELKDKSKLDGWWIYDSFLP